MFDETGMPFEGPGYFPGAFETKRPPLFKAGRGQQQQSEELTRAQMQQNERHFQANLALQKHQLALASTPQKFEKPSPEVKQMPADGGIFASMARQIARRADSAIFAGRRGMGGEKLGPGTTYVNGLKSALASRPLNSAA